MDARGMKHVLMGVSALAFSFVVARKWYNRSKKPESASASASATVPVSSTNAAVASTSTSSDAKAPEGGDAMPARAPSLSHVPSYAPLTRTSSDADTPCTPSIDPEVRRAIREEAKHMPRPLVVCGPSGVGKGTLLAILLKEFPEHFAKSISHTTRKPRPGEMTGVHYHFTTLDEMKKDVAEHKFVESCFVHGNLYGTSVASVHAVAQTGKVCILEIDIQGAEKIRKLGQLKPHYLFILPPDLNTLTERLQGRGTETADTLKTRIQTSVEELEKLKATNFFQFQIENNSLESAYRDLRRAVLECYPHLSAIADDATAERLLKASLTAVELQKKPSASASASASSSSSA